MSHKNITLENLGKLKKVGKYSNKTQALTQSITPIQHGPFRGCSRTGVQKAPLPKICHTCPTMMELGTVILT